MSPPSAPRSPNVVALGIQGLLGWYDELSVHWLASLVTTRQLLVLIGAVVWPSRIRGYRSTRKNPPLLVGVYGWGIRQEM